MLQHLRREFTIFFFNWYSLLTLLLHSLFVFPKTIISSCSISSFCFVIVKSLSCVWLFVTPWTVAHQAPPSMEFSRQRVLEWVAISLSLKQNFGIDWINLYYFQLSLSKLREMVKDRKARNVAVHGVTKSQLWLSDWTTTPESLASALHHYSLWDAHQLFIFKPIIYETTRNPLSSNILHNYFFLIHYIHQYFFFFARL